MPLSASEKVATIIGIVLLPRLLPRFGKRNLIGAGCLLGIAGQLLFLLDIKSIPLGVVSCIMRGFGIAPFYGVQYSLPTDAIEYGHWKKGLRVEGLMFSSVCMGQEIGSGLTVAAMGAVLSMAAFDGSKATAAEQTVEAISAIKGFYLYAPIIIWVIMLLITACYKLDKVYDRMMKELVAREGKEVLGNGMEKAAFSGSTNHLNVAVCRLYGSSGRRVAEGIAEALGCRVYDRQIICLMAEELGMETANLEEVQKYLNDDGLSKDVTFSPYSCPVSGAARDYSDLEIFEKQSRLILSIAKKSAGVFLGRCANFVLSDMPHTYSFFIYADDEYRKQEGKEYYKGQSLEELKKRDEQRNEYYRRFTGMDRNDLKNYDLVVNVSKTGVDGAIQMILSYIGNKEKEGENDVE
ncbi:cytidylate kinase family protein [Lachnospiraceae bacterium 54-53]